MMLNKQKISIFHAALYGWYAKNGRKELPWRTTSDPYAIYISEIMLQQTQVKTVLERYYFQFLKLFPTLQILANSSKEEVLKAWQGLGYYNRATNVHKTAKLCRTALPKTAEELMALPGIGRNTAHAICAFAYHQPVAVMEANVKRVLCRIFALDSPKNNELWERANRLLNRKNPFDYNQAMMDIGAIVCRKRAPDCPACPANIICRGKNQPELYPAPKQKKPTPVRKKTIVVFQNEKGDYFAMPRKTRFLGGMYHFSEFSTQAVKIVFLGKIYSIDTCKKLGHITQSYSHFTLKADLYLCKTICVRGKNWYSKNRLAKLPMSGAEQKILALL